MGEASGGITNYSISAQVHVLDRMVHSPQIRDPFCSVDKHHGTFPKAKCRVLHCYVTELLNQQLPLYHMTICLLCHSSVQMLCYGLIFNTSFDGVINPISAIISRQ